MRIKSIRHIPGEGFRLEDKPELTHDEVDALDISVDAKERLHFYVRTNPEGKVITATSGNGMLELHGWYGVRNFLIFFAVGCARGL